MNSTKAPTHSRRRGTRIRFSSPTAIVGVLILVTAGIWTYAAAVGGPSHHSSSVRLNPVRTKQASDTPARKRSIPGKNAPIQPQTFLGSSGIESTAILKENRFPGTTSWRITDSGATGFIEGFADHVYASVGDQVGLFVSTDAPRFQVTGYRMGWYQGSGAREMWQSPEVTGMVQPNCPNDPTVNMVSCHNWTRSLTIAISSSFVSGDYLFKLTGSGDQQSYVILTVIDPSSTSTYVIVNRSLTEEAWNTYGGFDFYQGTGSCIVDRDTYPVCNRARVVSFDRPFASGNGSSDFLSNEFPLVQYAEKLGLDVTYQSDVTVDAVPGVLNNHKALISLGHDEMWTNSERKSVLTAFARGMNVAFLGAAALVRHARLQPSSFGPGREVVDYRNSAEDPLNGKGDPMEVTGNTWSTPPSSWSAGQFVGEIYSGFLEPGTPAAAFVVQDASSWLYAGTGLQRGSTIPGIIESDIDHAAPMGAAPGNVEILGHSPVPLVDAYTNEGKWGQYTYSDLTYYTDPTAKAGVIDIGNNNWINAMTPCSPSGPSCPAAVLDKITGNIFRLFGLGPAGAIEPSSANGQAVVPLGS